MLRCAGTPLQNHLGELFTLLHFLDPVKFASQQAFDAEYGNLAAPSPATLPSAASGSSAGTGAPAAAAAGTAAAAAAAALTPQQKADRLHALLAPHMLRRLKRDVLQRMPPKQERLVRVELSEMQASALFSPGRRLAVRASSRLCT